MRNTGDTVLIIFEEMELMEVSELTVFNKDDGLVVVGKHGSYYFPFSDLFKVSATTKGLSKDKDAVDVALKVEPKIEQLREHARLLNQIADSLEKREGMQ